MDTLTGIRVFRQVVESGSFVSAAERLEMSTAAVGKHVKCVEQRLGVRLLNRNSRNLSLTEPGTIYFERCKSILDDLQATELELGYFHARPRGTLRITCPTWYAGSRMANLLAGYRRRYPEVVVDISFEDRFVDLVDESYDLVLRIASSRNSLAPSVVARPVRPATFCLAASHEYIKRRGAPRSPEQLSHHDFVAVGTSGVVVFTGAERAHEVPVHVVLRYRSMSGLVNAVAAGIGIAPIPTEYLQDPQFADVLTPVLTEQCLQDAMLYVVYLSRTLLSPKLRTFVDFITESLSPNATAQTPPFGPSAVDARTRKAAKPVALPVGAAHTVLDLAS